MENQDDRCFIIKFLNLVKKMTPRNRKTGQENTTESSNMDA